MKLHRTILTALLVLNINSTQAETDLTWDCDMDWFSVTLDNDLFLGNDNGYTNGIFLSTYDTGVSEAQPAPNHFSRPLLWSLTDKKYAAAVNAYSFGQVMMAPDDITIENPDQDQLPYSGLLFFSTTYLAINHDYVDKLGTTLGIIGPAAGAKLAQKAVHKWIGSDDPKGWDTQLENELVFQLRRGRLWRSWVSENQHTDLLLTSEAGLGTLASFAQAGMVVRYGRGLNRSYASVFLNDSRITNPVAIDNGWYLYAGMTAGYIFNQIYTDGNTFRDSRSIEYDHEQLGLIAGLAYSWGKLSMTIALNDADILDTRSEEELEDLTQYGSLSIAYKLK
jgi:lipid A 3-O-deacylase